MPLAPPSPNLVVWLEADVGVFTDTAGTTPAVNDGDLIVRWSDQSGNGNHVLQATSGNRPVFKTNVLGGKPVLRFLTASAQTLLTLPTAKAGGFSFQRHAPESRVLQWLHERFLLREVRACPALPDFVLRASRQGRWSKWIAWFSRSVTFDLG